MPDLPADQDAIDSLVKAVTEALERQAHCGKETGHRNRTDIPHDFSGSVAHYRCDDCDFFGERPLNTDEREKYRRWKSRLAKPMSLYAPDDAWRWQRFLDRLN
jgi:hypothetical protein